MEVGWVGVRLEELMVWSLYIRDYFRWAIWVIQVKRLLFSLFWLITLGLSFLWIIHLAVMELLLQELIIWVRFCVIIAVVICAIIRSFELIISEGLLEFT